MAKITISKILDKANQNFDVVTTKIATNVQSATKKELAKETSSIDESSAFTNWKSQFGTPMGDNFTIPSDVYKAIAKAVSAGIDDSIFEKSYSLNESQTIQTVANQIGAILNQLDPVTVPVNENGKKVNYVVEFTGSGLSQNVFTVRKPDGKRTLSTILTSKNSNLTNLKKAMAKYCIALYQLEHDAIKKVKKECLKIFATNAIDVVKTAVRLVAENTPISNLKKVLTTIGGSDTDSELKKFLNSSVFKQISSEYLKIEIKNALNNNNDKNTANTLDSYQTLTTYYNNLIDAVSNNKSETVIKKAVDEFNILAKSMLGASFVKVPYPADDVHYNKGLTEVTIPASYGHYVDIGDYEGSVKKIYATEYASSVNITGNKNANVIYSGTGSDNLYGGIGKDTIFGGSGNDSIYGENDADKLYGDAGNDVLSGGNANDTLYGGADNDSLYGDAGTDKLYGDAGNDTLVGGLGNDTLTGGSGKDVFYYANGDGNDIILDYVSSEDKIKISSGSVSNYSVSGGKDAILKVGNGKITLKNVGNNQITVITSDNRTVTYGGISNGLTFNKADLPKATAASINSNYSGSFETGAYSSLVTVDASTRSNSISIVGNAKSNKFYGGSAGDILSGGNGNDTLYGGSGNDSICGEKDADKIYGDAGNDTLIGGLGNDTLTGGAGKDVFYYTNGDGADVIVDFIANEDKIYISGATSVTGSLSKNDVTFKVGKGSIKVQNVKDKEIVIEYSNNTFGKYFNGKLIESGTISDIPDNATYYKGHYYRIYNDGMTWEEAKTFCENLGGHLVTITDASEQSVIEGLLHFYGNKNCYWIGCKLNLINQMNWITNERMIYSNWYDGEPDNYLGNQGYAFIGGKQLDDSIGFGKWGDIQQDGDSWDHYIYWGIDNLGFICEWDENQYKPTDKIIPSNAFSYNGNYYYIYSNIGDDWEEAKKYCETLGGHLAVINNSAENTAVFNYMNSQGYDSAYFGLSNTIKAGTWNWVDGNQITYTNWADGEPNNEGGNENYAMFYYKFTDGKWNDGNPQKDPASFICEWEGGNVLTSARVAEDYWFVEDDNFMTNDSEFDSIIEENYSVTNIETSDFNSLTNDEFTLTYNQSENNQ